MVEIQQNSQTKSRRGTNQNRSLTPTRQGKTTHRRQPQVRKVNGFIVFVDDVLGEGQYGKVCKAQLAEDLLANVQGTGRQAVRSTVDPTKQIYACKIIEIGEMNQEDLDCIHKEVKIHGMVRSDHSVRLHQTIKTTANIYMMQEYANAYDLSVLLKVRRRIRQEEARIIMNQLVIGIKDVWALGIIHRDMKLANILLHFPNNPQLEAMNRQQKKAFLAEVDLTKVKFQIKISDFGLSTILDGTNTQLSICGTPLYSAPQLLKKRGYSAKVDTWALGVILYEMLMGVTPFHSYEMKDLIAKINDGRFNVALDEPITVECALFLTQCLQMNENERIPVDELQQHPFISATFVKLPLTILDVERFSKEMAQQKRYSISSASYAPNNSVPPHVSEATTDGNQVILTTKACDQKTILVRQLVESDNFEKANVNIAECSYFSKHYEKPDNQFVAADGTSKRDLIASITSMCSNHFSSSTAGVGENKDGQEGVDPEEEVLKETDIDEDMFIFPDRKTENLDFQDEEQKTSPRGPKLSNELAQTSDIIKQINIKNEKRIDIGSITSVNEATTNQADLKGNGGQPKKKGKVKRFFRALCCMKDDDIYEEQVEGENKRCVSAPRAQVKSTGSSAEEKQRLLQMRRQTEQELNQAKNSSQVAQIGKE